MGTENDRPADMPPKHQTRLRVRYAETDQMGVAYHANYLVWMEIGRVELVRSRGCNYKDLEQNGFYLAVVAVECRYLYPARYDQEIVVETEILSVNPRVVEFGYEIRSADPSWPLAPDRLLARGSTRHVWLNRVSRPTRLPEEYGRFLRVG